MKSLMKDVADFHHATDCPVHTAPAIPNDDRKKLRMRLITEEFNETIEAMVQDDLYEIADGLADLIYVIVGTALEYGIPLEDVWNIVQDSNMSKTDPITKKVKRRKDGKILKPDNYVDARPGIKACIDRVIQVHKTQGELL